MTTLALMLWLAAITLGAYAVHQIYVRRLVREIEAEKARSHSSVMAGTRNLV
jgi:hypothetical protein